MVAGEAADRRGALANVRVYVDRQRQRHYHSPVTAAIGVSRIPSRVAHGGRWEEPAASSASPVCTAARRCRKAPPPTMERRCLEVRQPISSIAWSKGCLSRAGCGAGDPEIDVTEVLAARLVVPSVVEQVRDVERAVAAYRDVAAQPRRGP